MSQNQMSQNQTTQSQTSPATEQGLKRDLKFVASYPKSGNTWVRMAAICYSTGRADLSALGRMGDLCVQDYHDVSPVPLSQLGLPAQAQIRPAAMLNLAFSLGGKQEHAIKSHHAFLSIEGVPLWHPSFVDRVVNPVRDPREICCSAKEHFGFESYEETAKFMAKEGQCIGGGDRPIHHVIGSWAQHVNSWQTAPLDVMTVKYEDLKADPLAMFEKIFGFLLDEEVDRYRVEEAVKATDFDHLKELEDEHGFPEKSDQADRFFRSGKTDGWKEELPTGVARTLEDEFGKTMEGLGYL